MKGLRVLKVNEYFDGKVKSIGLTVAGERATSGVMAPGEYDFDTSSHETITVVAGELSIKQPGSETWETYGAGDTFEVDAGIVFGVRVKVDTAYLCLYRDA